jgi:hypothetical protein
MAHILRLDEGWHLDTGLVWGQLVPDHPPRHHSEGAKHMAGDIIPKPRALYRAWLLHLKTDIATDGPTLGLEAGDITAVQATCTGQMTKIDDTDAAWANYQAKVQAEATGRRLTNAALREEIAQWKLADGYTDEIGARLQIVSTGSAFDPDNYQCEFTVRIVAGEIRIDWKKKGADAVHVYARLRGQSAWTKLGMDTNSPYIDGRPLAQPGVPEVREYMLRGLVNDEEIGLDSLIHSVTWAGN